MTCGDLAALSVSVMVSLRCPELRGAKVTETVQEAFAASTAPEQLLGGLLKSAGLLPPTATEEMRRVALPELVTVTLVAPLVVPCVVAAKMTGLGAMVMAGAGPATALPCTLMICGELAASSLTVMVSVRWPAASGAKVTEIAQEALAA